MGCRRRRNSPKAAVDEEEEEDVDRRRQVLTAPLSSISDRSCFTGSEDVDVEVPFPPVVPRSASRGGANRR